MSGPVLPHPVRRIATMGRPTVRSHFAGTHLHLAACTVLLQCSDMPGQLLVTMRPSLQHVNMSDCWHWPLCKPQTVVAVFVPAQLTWAAGATVSRECLQKNPVTLPIPWSDKGVSTYIVFLTNLHIYIYIYIYIYIVFKVHAFSVWFSKRSQKIIAS